MPAGAIENEAVVAVTKFGAGSASPSSSWRPAEFPRPPSSFVRLWRRLTWDPKRRLLEAVRDRCLPELEAALAAGADVNSAVFPDGLSALHGACESGWLGGIDAQPEKMKQTFSGGPVAGLFVAHYWALESGKTAEKAERAEKMMVIAQRLGATWAGTERLIAQEAPERSGEFQTTLLRVKTVVDQERWEAALLPSPLADRSSCDSPGSLPRRRM